MKKVFAVSIALLMATVSVTMYAQQNVQTPILEPKLTVAEVQFALQLLNRVTLQGNEVEAFLEVQRTLQNALKQATDAKKGPQDEAGIKLPLPVAQNLLAFMQRAQLTGAEAPVYKQITDKIVASARVLNQQNQQQGGGQQGGN